MRALDLFCGGGGASAGLHQSGLFDEVVGVDLSPQPDYPFRFIQADVLHLEPVFLEQFDFIWASPPCQRYSEATRVKDGRFDSIPPTRELLLASGRPYVIENVKGAYDALQDPIFLCGQMFGLPLVRHRHFETSWIPGERPEHVHRGSLVKGEVAKVTGHGGAAVWVLHERDRLGLPRNMPADSRMEFWSRAMEIDWLPRKTLVQAIPPAYSKWLALDWQKQEGPQ